MISETDKAYIAGLFDGEGCISASLYKTTNRNAFGLNINVSICICDKDLMLEIKDITKTGTVRKHSTHKTAHAYEVRAKRDVLTFLEIIYPYLKHKKELARIMIIYVKSRIISDRHTHTDKEINLIGKIIKFHNTKSTVRNFELWKKHIRKNRTTTPHHKYWTKKEENYLKTNYLKMFDSELAKKLSRTKPAIAHRRFDLGLFKPRDFRWRLKEAEI